MQRSTKRSIELRGRSFSLDHKGNFGLEFRLKSSEKIIATASQKPFFDNYKLVHDGKEWTFKAVGILARKFGLFRGDTEIGSTTSGPFANLLKEITVDLPDELPPEVQPLLILVRNWSDTSQATPRAWQSTQYRDMALDFIPANCQVISSFLAGAAFFRH